jgi:ubiquinone/menaquinone biosynthesis C-methylase UbiE
VIDDAKTLAEQYADADNLNARIRLHERYSTADQPWWPWVYDRVRDAVGAAGDVAESAGDARVFEVGCGPGDLWAENADRVPDGWRTVHTDFSAGMVEEFRATTGDLGLDPDGTAAAAAEALPFPDDAFDVAVANHMLYYVDRDRALPEIRRVLRPGGRLVATTNGEDNMREVRALLDEVRDVWTPTCAAFSLQNGPDQLRAVFEAVERHDFESGLRVSDLEPLVAYAGSLPGMGEAETAAFAAAAREALADGPLAVHKEQGALVAVVER